MKLAIAACILLFSAPALGAEFTCHVTDVTDGDTIACIASDKTVKVRLVDIDAPETAKPGKPGQPFGNEAERELERLVGDRDVRIDYLTTDRYGRILGTIYAGTTDVNASLVSTGHAWVYREYSKGQRETDLLLAEKGAGSCGNVANKCKDAARVPPELRRGLWKLQEDQRMYPADWRAGGWKTAPAAEDDQSVVPPTIIGQGPECGTKKYCSQMRDCAEAKAFFANCKGMEKLDGNKDGKPCEDLCR